MTRTVQGPSRTVQATLSGVGVALGVLVAVLVNDVILGVIAGAVFIAITVMSARLWTGSERPRHP